MQLRECLEIRVAAACLGNEESCCWDSPWTKKEPWNAGALDCPFAFIRGYFGLFTTLETR